MLFDLKGKRRRTVQGVYLMLAVLMGAGLVLFGIGSSVNGGLGDLFKGGNGSNQANQTIQKKIDAAEKTLQANPKNAAALAQVVRGHYQLATATADPQTSEFTKDSRPDLVASTAAWKRYEATVKKPDLSLTQTAIQAYDGLGRLTANPSDAKPFWAGASDATEVVASAKPSSRNYITLLLYATLAGQDRKATLAEKQAIKLAPKGQAKQVKSAVAQAKAAATTQQQQATSSSGGGAAPSAPTP
jgi:hypothetical protein